MIPHQLVAATLRARGLPESHIASALPESVFDTLFAIEGGARDEPSWWPDALALKDDYSLVEIARRLGVGVDILAAEFRDRRILRRARPKAAGRARGRSDSGSASARTGSKDAQIEQFVHLVGQVPDAEVARMADVSVRTLASFRQRRGIAGFSGPRRRPIRLGPRTSKVEDFEDLIGIIPDRAVADIAGMSLGAVRNYRVKRRIEPCGRKSRAEISQIVHAWRERLLAVGHQDPLEGVSSPMIEPLSPARSTPVPSAPAQRSAHTLRAWRLRTDRGGEPVVVLAPDMRRAFEVACRSLGTATLVAIEDCGEVLSH